MTADGKIRRHEFRGVFEHSARQIPLHNATPALQLTTSEPRGLTAGMTVHCSIE